MLDVLKNDTELISLIFYALICVTLITQWRYLPVQQAFITFIEYILVVLSI
jgi:hypothetical protein